MYVDDCTHSFEELAASVLPAHMGHLDTALRSPTPMSVFGRTGVGPASIARDLGLTGDFSGCYVLVDSGKSFYVGISRKVLSRLRQHVRGETHFAASLAYAMAQRRKPTAGTRGYAMNNPEFHRAFVEARAHLHELSVAFVEIENALELHIFEAYAAIKLSTHEWNTFRTH